MQHPTHRTFAARAIGAALILSTLALAGCADLSFPTMPDAVAFGATSGVCSRSTTTATRDAEAQRARATPVAAAACTAGGPRVSPPKR